MNNNVRKMLDTNTCPALEADSPMEALSLLDSAEVKADVCPVCHASSHLERDKGFKICPNCRSVFKVFNNISYTIRTHVDIDNMTINELIWRTKKPRI